MSECFVQHTDITIEVPQSSIIVYNFCGKLGHQRRSHRDCEMHTSLLNVNENGESTTYCIETI
jgi:hypothetical protein